MIKKIHELRKKSHAEKERIALMGATIVTFFIVLFWLAGVNTLYKTDVDQRAQVGAPFDELKESVSGVFKK